VATSWRDAPLLLLVAALAFLLASFPARNSDLWAHAAAGKGLVQGIATPGTDTGSAYANHSTWLADILLYVGYTRLGGPGLVLAKSFLVALLALALLRLGYRRQGWWLPAVCTVLALLAMGTRLLLQPTILSYLFLALALLLVCPEEERAAKRLPRRLPPWPLLLLFAVWVNLDAWFMLGLLTVGLVLLGKALDEALAPTAQRDGELNGSGEAASGGSGPALFLRPALWFGLLVAACLLNPAGVGALALPPELGGVGAGRTAVTSPFQAGYFAGPGLTPAGLAYFPLLGLSLLSFAGAPRGRRWRRLLPWAVLALLSVLQVRLIPFFAIVAGPTLAWNLQPLLGARRMAPAAGRALAVLVSLVLIACAWPGWLQSPPFEPRHWAAEVAPALKRGAEAVRTWYEEGKLPAEARGLHLSADSAAAFAWLCPTDRALRSDRLAAVAGGRDDTKGWREGLRAAAVDHVVVYDTDRGRLFATLSQFLSAPQEWPLLYQEGDVVVFGWRDPARAGEADRLRGWHLDLDRLAFHPPRDKRAPAQPSGAPAEERPWWAAFWQAAPPRSVDRDEATLYLFQAEAERQAAPRRHQAAWEAGEAAALAGAAGPWAGPPAFQDAYVRLVLFRPRLPHPSASGDGLTPPDRMALALQQEYVKQQDELSPALPYLAIRAARRALAANPAQAQAHLVLGESYMRLFHGTHERIWGERLSELVQLRRAQASAAFNQAITLKPDLAQARFSLAVLYEEMGYLDLALEQLRAHARLVHQAGPERGRAEEFREREAWLEGEVGRLAQKVESRQDAYEVAAAGLPVLNRASMALEKGLAGKARDVLLSSDLSAFGAEGMALELQLLLATGRPKEVVEWTSPEQQGALGPRTYHWLRAQALAALGDYAGARQECAELAQALLPGDPGREIVPPRWAAGLLVAQAVLDVRPGLGIAPNLLSRTLGRVQFLDRMTLLTRGLKRGADVDVLRGLIALEEGRTDEAEAALREALAVWRDEAAAASGAGVDFNGRPAALGYLAWLE
jgi:hypothetical protein